MTKPVKKVKIFSALEVANLCGVVNQTAINWIRSGFLKAFMTPGGQYRVYADDLIEFLESRGMRIPAEIAMADRGDLDWSTLLVVDDDAELNDILRRWFLRKIEGITVHQAFDGFEAGKILAEKKPGFVILDINLPGLDGHTICRRIKADPAFGKPFIIAMTGFDRPEEAQAILSEGADAFFAKPLDFEAMVGAVKDFASRFRAGEAVDNAG